MGIVRKNRHAAMLALLGLWLVLQSGCGQKMPPPTNPSTGTPSVRVRLLQDASSVSLAADGSALVRTSSGSLQRVDLPAKPGIVVSLGPAGWRVGTASLPSGELTFEPEPSAILAINSQRYRGSLTLVPTGVSTFDVVNHVDVDSYLQGVLAKELRPEFGIEAYKAQAIVARTYALYQSRTAPPGRPWDLYPDTRSQVYGGVTAESAKSRLAVDETSGVVVAYGPAGHEKIFKAYFSACCGGATQSASQAFGDADIPPLSDQAVGARCAQSPRFNWGPLVISKQELTERFRAFGRSRNRLERDIGTIQQIDISVRNASGRPVQFIVIDARGRRYMLSGEELRWAVNTGAGENGESSVTLPSSFVHPVSDTTTIRFEDGHGAGHGVGLCQWCAQAQAQQGTSHEQIVLSAFRGSRLVRAY